jgi:hypothetical protein
MSKKKKTGVTGQSTNPHPQIAAKPVHQPLPKEPIATVKNDSESLIDSPGQPFELIRFDKRLKRFLGISIGLFLLLTLAKIHTSSIPVWNSLIPDGSNPKRGLIAGTPRTIRMDEWSAMVPFVLSQANNGYPQENPAIGGGKPGLVVYLPIKHFIMAFRPNYWGFGFLDVDRGFAWNNLFYPFFGYIVTVLLLLLLTRNQFWLSVLGGLWLILSPGIAWWSFSPLTHVFSGSIILIASFYVFYARSLKTILWAAPLFAWALITFSLNLYPPYQVPYGYLLIFLLIGFIWRYFRKDILFDKVTFKLIGFAIAGLAVGAIVYAYYTDAKPTIDAMSNTVYPGKRSESGGTGFVANWLSEYYSSWLLNDQKFPATWMNICELSHAVTFMPAIAVAMAIYYYRKKELDPLVCIILIYSIVLLVWIEIGFPTPLAKATLLDVSPTRRTQVPLGITNVMLSILYLAYINRNPINLPFNWKAILAVLAIAFMAYAAWLNLNDSGGFYKAYQLFLPTLFFIALHFVLLPITTISNKGIWIAGAMLLFSLPGLGVNPIAKGLSPITEHVLYQKVREIHTQDPTARWTVISNVQNRPYLTYLLTATGVNQLSGIKFIPDFKTMRVLDPTAKRDSAYNRYAHTVYTSFINGTDSTVILNQYEDGYLVALDPCSPKLKKLNAKYFLFENTPQPAEIRCMTQVATLGSLSIYKRNDF